MSTKELGNIRNALIEIEKRLKAEKSDQVRKEFWKIVGKIKRIPSLPDDLIVKAAEIREILFEKRVILSLRKGAAIFVTGFTLSIMGFAHFLKAELGGTVGIIGLVIANFFTLYFSYPLGRLLGGMISNIKFEGFYQYSPGELGLKIEYKSYLKARAKRQLMFAFTFFWIFALQMLLLAVTYIFARGLIAAPIMILIFIAVSYSIATRKKTGELYRFIRERRINAKLKRKL